MYRRSAAIGRTEGRPHGLRYSFTLHDVDGSRLLDFDNAHGVSQAQAYDIDFGTRRSWCLTIFRMPIGCSVITLYRRHGPRRRPCGGLLTIFFDVDTFDVLWFCPPCDDNGRISGWEGKFWDNSDVGEVAS